MEAKIAIEKIKNCITENYMVLARKHNFKLVLVLHPALCELETSRFSLAPLANELQDTSGIFTINLYNEFKRTKDSIGFEYRSLFWQKDGHNNSKGYNLWADIVCNKLLNNNLIQMQDTIEAPGIIAVSGKQN